MMLDKQQFTKQLGRAIAQYRQKLGLTQEEIAEKLGITNEAVSKVERGVATPSLPRLLEYAEILDCRLIDLLSLSSERLPDQTDYISQLLEDLNDSERRLVIDMIEKMVEYFSKNK